MLIPILGINTSQLHLAIGYRWAGITNEDCRGVVNW